MARKLGYGGIANSPLRDFTGKESAVAEAVIQQIAWNWLFTEQQAQGNVDWFAGGGTVAGGGEEDVTVDTQTFTVSGTWTKPANAQFVYVVCIAPGGKGGSGRKGAAGTARGGGGGGGGGEIREAWLLAQNLPATMTVEIGAAATGGTAVSANDTDGVNGIDGGDAVFGDDTSRSGSYHTAFHGFSGKGGTADNTGGAGGADSNGALIDNTLGAGIVSYTTEDVSGAATHNLGSGAAGAHGGKASVGVNGLTGKDGQYPTSINWGPPGGGGGGGISAADAVGTGGNGGRAMVLGTTGGAGGAASTNGSTGTAGANVTPGGGGGGGGASITGNAGDGGIGGQYGAGGGGGGAALNDVGNSGAGGIGGAAVVLVKTICAA